MKKAVQAVETTDGGPTGEAARQPIPPEVVKLLQVQTAEVRDLVNAAVETDALPIPLPKRLLSAWGMIRTEYPALVHGYHPDLASLPEELDWQTRGGYWLQRAKP